MLQNLTISTYFAMNNNNFLEFLQIVPFNFQESLSSSWVLPFIEKLSSFCASNPVADN